jgi:hypothetical protein
MARVQWWVPMKKGKKYECIYMKIVRMVSGNVILQIQNSGLIFHPFFSHFQPKKNSNKSQNSIPIACVSRAKVNLDVAMCERCFKHGGNCVFDILEPFI